MSAYTGPVRPKIHGYDTTANPYNLQWEQRRSLRRQRRRTGTPHGHAIGSTVIRCAMPDNSVHATTRVTVHDGTGESLAAELSRPFDDALVYSRSVYLQRNTIMQSFDIETDGTLWYLQLGGNDPELLYVLRGAPNESPKDYMMLRWFGHGTNFAVEEQGAERYIWIGSNGNKLSDGSYSQSNTVSRLKYSPDKNRKLDLCGGDTFFIKDKWNVHPAIDTDNDILCITASTTGVRDFIFYRLSDALATPLSKVTLRTQTYGGEDADSPQKTETRTIEAHDLTSIAPLGSFTISVPGKDNLSQYDFQGFDVQDGLLYFYEGEAARKTAQVDRIRHGARYIRQHRRSPHAGRSDQRRERAGGGGHLQQRLQRIHRGRRHQDEARPALHRIRHARPRSQTLGQRFPLLIRIRRRGAAASPPIKPLGIRISKFRAFFSYRRTFRHPTVPAHSPSGDPLHQDARGPAATTRRKHRPCGSCAPATTNWPDR